MKFKEYASESTGGGSFLKIEDGQSVAGVLAGEFYEFYVKWTGTTNLVVNEGAEGAKIRFRANFITNTAAAGEPDNLGAKIWEFPVMLYNQLKEINEEYPLEETKIKISRKGTGKNTEYTIMPLVGGKNALKPEQIKVLKQIPLLKLEKKAAAPLAPPDGERNIENENWT